MSFRSLLTEDVTVVNPASKRDAYNNVVSDWGFGAQRTSMRGRIDQTQTMEIIVGRDTILSDSLLFLPPSVVIDGRSRVEARGETFEVVGTPSVVFGRRRPHHLELRLRQIEG